MKKILLVLTLTAITTQIMPHRYDKRDHRPGFLGRIIETPAYLVDPNFNSDDSYDDEYYGDDNGYSRSRSRGKNARSANNSKRASKAQAAKSSSKRR